MRFIRDGRAAARGALHMATLSAVRYNPALTTFYRAPRGKGEGRQGGNVTAVARKLTHPSPTRCCATAARGPDTPSRGRHGAGDPPRREPGRPAPDPLVEFQHINTRRPQRGLTPELARAEPCVPSSLTSAPAHLEHTPSGWSPRGRVRLEGTTTHALSGIESVPRAFEITANKAARKAINPARVMMRSARRLTSLTRRRPCDKLEEKLP